MESFEGRRRSIRAVPPEGEFALGTLVVGTRQIPVLILDESIAGMGLVAVHTIDLPVGGNIEFRSHVRHLEGRIGSVRYVRICEARISCIGLQWTD